MRARLIAVLGSPVVLAASVALGYLLAAVTF
jgi:hypothetical protein